MTERIKVVTLGCEKNMVDSKIMSGFIRERGYQLVEQADDATVIIVNACGFIDDAKEESVNTILDMAEFKQTGRLKALIVSGCLTQRYKQQLITDLYDTFMLPELLNRVSEADGIAWVQLHDAYPGFFTDEFIETIVCKIRSRVSDVALRTSIIAGFPGETDEDFNRLCDFVPEMKFDRLGIFTYSPEEDTPAVRLPSPVPDDVKEWRSNALVEIQRNVSKNNSGQYIGREIDVLVERYDGRSDIYIGRSEYDAPEIDGEVFISNCQAGIGEIQRVRVTHAYEFDMSGEGLS